VIKERNLSYNYKHVCVPFNKLSLNVLIINFKDKFQGR
jgi:hypothetical protein